MTQICSPGQIPTFADIKAMLAKVDFSVALPPLPTIPNPLFPTLTSPDFSYSTLATEMMTNQFLAWIKAVIDPIMAFVGSIPLPTVPEIGASLDELLSATGEQINAWVAGIRAKLSSIKPPLLPDPITPGITSPFTEAVAKFQALIREYCMMLVNTVKQLMQMVKDKLSIPPFNFGLTIPTIPDIPTTFDGLMAPILAPLNIPSLKELIARYQLPTFTLPGIPAIPPLPTIPEIFSVPFPGFDFVAPTFKFPTPWYGAITSPAMEIVEASKAYFMTIIMGAAKKIEEFTQLVTSFIPFDLPTICIECQLKTA